VIDRFHFYLPGWEIPKNSKAILTDHYGFVTDYLAEALRALRKQNRFDALEGRSDSARTSKEATPTASSAPSPASDEAALSSRGVAEGRAESLPGVRDGRPTAGEGAAQKARLVRVPPDHLLYIDASTSAGGRSSRCPSKGARRDFARSVAARHHLHGVHRRRVPSWPSSPRSRADRPEPASCGRQPGMPKGMKESLNRAWSLLQTVKDRQGPRAIARAEGSSPWRRWISRAVEGTATAA
jgi:ATP-dependent Lon protease